MKLNLNCIRDILLTLSEKLIPDESGYIVPLSPSEFSESELSQYEKNEVMYWIRKLMDEGIIIKGKKYVDSPLPLIKDISMAGYQFIEATEKPSAWNTIKPKLSEIAISSVTTLINTVISLTVS